MSRRSRPATTTIYSESSGALLSRAALVFFAGEFVHGGILHDLLPRDLPCFLDDPRQRTILTSRLVLDLFQHLLRKVQGLLALVGTAHWTTKPPRVVEVGECKLTDGQMSRKAVHELDLIRGCP